MHQPVHVTSEIGQLRAVVLRRPGQEIENLTPDYIGRLLFEDIPYLPVLQYEHDYFANALRNRGAEVIYLEQLAADALYDRDVRSQFIEELLSTNKTAMSGSVDCLREYLQSLPNNCLVEKVMAGVRKNEVIGYKKTHLYEMLDDDYPFYLDPMPNLYFTRDPAAAIGDGLSINHMTMLARNNESLFMKYILQYHPRFANQDIPVWYNREDGFAIEGGDQLVLSDKVLAIGMGERSTPQAIETLALRLFNSDASFRKIVAIKIPKIRAFMHLDTIFTMVDRAKFTIHPLALDVTHDMRIYILEPGKDKDTLHIEERSCLTDTLKEVLELDQITFIPCGGTDPIASAREQWNDGSNTLAIAPGVVVTYDRNYVSNALLREEGLEVIEIPGSELSRGRGGPRCMSMPLVREDI